MVPTMMPVPTTPKKAIGKALWAGLVQCVWTVTVLLWPVLNLIVIVDVTLQFFRMLYYWNTPGVYAGWTFLLHFAVLTALIYFVAVYKPKGV